MSHFLIAFSLAAHNLAAVIFIGYYVLLALIHLPALQAGAPNSAGALISAISKRSRAWLYASLIVFAVSGAYLTLEDPSYLGLANFGNLWTILMLVKHILVVVMIVVGLWFNAILRVGPMASSNTGAAQAIANFRRYVNVMAITGVAVLLLTAVAQAL
ncbi:MAG TPA: hypothetical protein VF784_16830 [Anaerolineales bacterium]